MDKPKRRSARLKEYDYNKSGTYFLTMCTMNKKKILCDIEEENGDIKLKMKKCGEIAYRNIVDMNKYYSNINISKFVIMPNHIHMLVEVENENEELEKKDFANAIIPSMISYFKRKCNKDIGENIWQRSYYDRIVRNQRDYEIIWRYIDENVQKWSLDCYYGE